MKMKKSKYSGKTLNFFELLQEHVVQIPIIQRDYAQGRDGEKEIRDNFLNALHDCIADNNPIKLDFVYGSIVDGKFQPLDGQQRLTTLFLLHWYAATKESLVSDDKTLNTLIKFTYETRISSREFCADLVKESISIGSQDQVISDLIVDSNWFFLSWKSDPTIDAMLRSIDAIHEKFYSVNGLWNKLMGPLIQFYFVELENMGLTDDLYIKMNARGKMLTSFENFKAGFQKRINEEDWEHNIEFKDSFGVKIDNDWTDLFWEFFRKRNSIDESLIRFIAAVAMIMQSVERVLSSESRIESIEQLQGEPSMVRPSHFTKNTFSYLISYLNTYHENVFLTDYNSARFPFPMWRHTPKSTILSMIVFDENTASTIQRESATYTQKILFFAQAEYMRKKPQIDDENYHDWMRVVRNIISRADIDKDGSRPDIIRSPQAFDGGINLINELSEGCLDIYQYLAKHPILKSQFAKEQLNEEVEKAKLIVSDSKLKQVLFNAEDNELLRGKIDFLFYVIDYDFSVTNFNAELFERVSDVTHKYFNSEDGLNNDVRRAMLTIEVNGAYDFYTYWWSYWHVGNSNKRRLFDKFREIEYFIGHTNYREYFKKLILDLLNKTPSQIVADFSPHPKFPNWKIRLIKEAKLLDEISSTNYIAIAKDNSHCYLLKSKRPREVDGNILIE